MAADLGAISAQGKCIKQRVPNAAMNVKYHSSQLKENQFFAKIAIRKRRAINSN